MKVTELKLPGLLHIEPRRFVDERGFFVETWNQSRYEECGVRLPFVQDNMSWSSRDVLRGLHFQNPRAQGKLVYVLVGEVFDVCVDIRKGSPTFGQWEGITLSESLGNQVYIPPGFAHGFLVMSPRALFCYKCTDFYSPTTDRGLIWNDPTVGIQWPTQSPIISKKDLELKPLRAIDDSSLVPYTR